MKFRILLFLCLLICSIATSSATDYYVSNSGNNLNSGNITNPWLTIKYSVTQVDAGDTIYVFAGNYNDLDITFSNSGNSTHPIRLLDYNGTILINASGTNVHTINAENKSYITIDGDFEIHSGYIGIDFQNCSNIIVKNVTVRDTIQAGYSIGIWYRDNTHDSIIDSCIVDHVGWNGIMIYGSDYSAHSGQCTRSSYNITVKNCIVKNNTIHNGIDVHSNNYNITIENCTSHNNNGQIGIFVHSAKTMNRNITVHNNTVYNNSRGIYLHSTYNSIVSNNTVYNHTGSSKYGLGLSASSEDPGLPFNIPHNITFQNNTAYNNCNNLYIANTDKTNYTAPNDITVTRNTFYDSLQSPGRDILCNNINGENLIFYDNNLQQSDKQFKIYYAACDINYTVKSDYIFDDNSAFPSAKYYTNGTSLASGNVVDTTFATYTIKLKPTNNYIYDVLINLYNVTQDKYNITLNSTAAENPTYINVTVSNSNSIYNITKNGTFYTNITSDSNSIINFNYNVSGNEFGTAQTFLFEYSPWAMPANTSYIGYQCDTYDSGLILHPNSNPVEDSVELTHFKMVVI